VQRKDFMPSEKVAIAEAIWERERANREAKKVTIGKQTGRGHKKGSGNLPEPLESEPQSRDVAAMAVGWGARTYEKAKAVVKAEERKKEGQKKGGRVKNNVLGGNLPPSTETGQTRDLVATRLGLA
jgi:hypothetical protein